MATHFSVLAWRIPGTGEPGGLLSMGLHRVGHDGKRLSSSSRVVKELILPNLPVFWIAQMVKNLPAMWETCARYLGWEDPLEKGMSTHSSSLAWIIPWTEKPGGLQSMDSQRVVHD